MGSTQSGCKPNATIIEQHKLLLKKIEKCSIHAAKTVAWSYDMEGHAKKCVEWCCELANKKTEQLRKVSTWMITTSRRRNWNRLENCHKFALKLSRKYMYLSRIGRPDILWSVNKLASVVTKWAGACDRRSARLIAYSSWSIGFIPRLRFCWRP